MKLLPGDSLSWLKMKDMNFNSICQNSNLPKVWQENNYTSNSLMPVNNYVKIFGNPPKVKDIQSDKITIVQKTYSDIYVEKNKTQVYAIERSWQRQFYPSKNTYSLDNINFFTDKCYRFYMPWVINRNVNYKVHSNEIKDFFYVPEQAGLFNHTNKNIDVPFIDFYFISKDFIKEDSYMLIPAGSDMYELDIYIDPNLIKDLFNLL